MIPVVLNWDLTNLVGYYDESKNEVVLSQPINPKLYHITVGAKILEMDSEIKITKFEFKTISLDFIHD